MKLNGKCLHLNFACDVNVARITPTGADAEVADAYYAEVTIQCADCGERFCFLGMDMGLDPCRPMMSADELEARIPIRPESETIKRLGPGFTIKATIKTKGQVN